MTLPFDTFVLSSIKKFGIDDDDEIVRKSCRGKKLGRGHIILVELNYTVTNL